VDADGTEGGQAAEEEEEEDEEEVEEKDVEEIGGAGEGRGERGGGQVACRRGATPRSGREESTYLTDVSSHG
jgi:hypothetical protein